jgi:hypothetical protein
MKLFLLFLMSLFILSINSIRGVELRRNNDNLNDGNWLVLFGTEWCGFCQDFKPNFKKA